MHTFKEYRGQSDFGCSVDPELDTWLILPCGRNREGDCLTESNFHTALERLGGENPHAEGGNVEVLRFGHWAVGWVEIILVRPGTPEYLEACEIEMALDDYPVLDDEDHSEREQIAAEETWQNCYNEAERIAYIRAHRSQFEPQSFADLLGCVRGKYFMGYASELLSR